MPYTPNAVQFAVNKAKNNMTYRFHLQKYRHGNKGTCPHCGRRRCFVRYVDERGEYIFPDNVGRCDHEVSCGYHYTPREYFRDHDIKPDKAKEDPQYSLPVRTQPPMPISYIDEKIVQASLCQYDKNPLFLFLSHSIGGEATEELFRRYRVGTASKWSGATVFWQTDIGGKVRSGKVMGYNPKDGHRIKEPFPQVCWAHTLLHLKDFNLKQCFFGEHLLAQSNTDVAVVESEKTAIIASHFVPDYIWIATGGKHGCLNPDALKVLKGRRVYLFPDLQAYNDWKDKEPLFVEAGCHVTTSNFLEEHAVEEEKNAGLDIGDFLLVEETKQQILKDILKRNPALQRLIDELDLEIVEIVVE